MSSGDLIVLLPWVIFGACLIAICIRLFTWRRVPKRHAGPGRGHGRAKGAAGQPPPCG